MMLSKCRTSNLRIGSTTLFSQFAACNHKPCTQVRRCFITSASKGFGSVSKKPQQAPAKNKRVEVKPPLNIDQVKPKQNVGQTASGGWVEVATPDDFELKPTKAVILPSGKALVVYKLGSSYYCSDANSTAYQFPLVDASVTQGPSGPQVEVPLDGTVYDLSTGRVLKWCPGGNPLKGVLGMLKKDTDPVDLQVYPCELKKDKKIYAKL